MYVHPLHAWCLQRPEEGSDPLELEFQVVESYFVGLGTDLSHLSSPISRQLLAASFGLGHTYQGAHRRL